MDQAMTLFEKSLGWASAIARNVHRRLHSCFDLQDLEQEARLKLWDCAQKFDASTGVPFQGYGYIRVRGAVLMSVRRRAWTEAMHESLEYDYVLDRDGDHGGRAGRMGHIVSGSRAFADPSPRADARIEAREEAARHQARLESLLDAGMNSDPEAFGMITAVLVNGVEISEVARRLRVKECDLNRRLLRAARGVGGGGKVRSIKSSRVQENDDVSRHAFQSVA